MLHFLKSRILRQDEKAPPENLKDNTAQLAACVILLEIAHADDEFSPGEQQVIASILTKRFHVNPEEIRQLLSEAEQRRAHSIDLWSFTDQINTHFDADQKQAVMEAAWRVIYADGKLDKHEDYLVHRLAELLRLPHSAMIQAKLKVKRELNMD